LVITIVASSFLGFCSKWVIRLPWRGVLAFMLSRSWGESEKTATSVPDINAEHKSRNIMPAKPAVRL